MGCVRRTNQRASARAHLWCRVNCISSRIVSGSLNKTVRIWDTVVRVHQSASLCSYILPTPGRLYFLPKASASSQGPMTRQLGFGILCQVHQASARGTLAHVWSVSGSPICNPLQGHSRHVQSVAFSPGGARIISGSSDKIVQVWDAVSCTSPSASSARVLASSRQLYFTQRHPHVSDFDDDYWLFRRERLNLKAFLYSALSENGGSREAVVECVPTFPKSFLLRDDG